MSRIYCPMPLSGGAELTLEGAAARHVQVLRLQPGDPLTLFNGAGGEYAAEVARMGRSDVQVRLGAHLGVEREARRAVHLALVMPGNERMDWLVEKATELGAASVTPLMSERSVVRLSGERAQKKQAHWQAVAVAAAEQCGRNRVPAVHAVQTLAQYLQSRTARPEVQRWLLAPQAQEANSVGSTDTLVEVLSGPEGGFSAGEEARAFEAGFQPWCLGPRVLRAETAPLVALVKLT